MVPSNMRTASSWRRSLLAIPHYKLAVAVIKSCQIVGHILSEKIFTNHVNGILLHVGALSYASVILLGEGGKENV